MSVVSRKKGKGSHGIDLGAQCVLAMGRLGCVVHLGCDGGGVRVEKVCWNWVCNSQVSFWLQK